MKFIFLVAFLFFDQNVTAQEAASPIGKIADYPQINAMLCLPMMAQVAVVALEAGPMSYKLPIFSEEIDQKLMVYLDVAKNKKTDLGSADMQAQALSMYSEAGALRPAAMKACQEFSAVVIGPCEKDKDAVDCINKRAAAPDAFEAAKKFALTLKDELLQKTEMKAATDMLAPLVEKKESIENAAGKAMAEFVANHYLKIIIGLWIFILGMVVLGVRRFRR